MVTRKGFVAKIEHFPPQKGDENESRRQKKGVFRLKMVTRKGIVAKIEHFPPQKGDENESRRRKSEFSGSK
jgi:uncharacterized membrane protein